MKPGINPGLSNAEYHADNTHLSSSVLKLILSSPKQYYEEKVLKQGPPAQTSAAMNLGSYVHSLILEPEKVAEEFAIYEGWRKQGADYEKFLAQHPNKIILSQPQSFNGHRLAKTVQACPPALDLLKGGVAELSHAAELLGVPVKMRADYLNVDQGYIVDVKTTRWPSDVTTFRRVVRELGYELSAALYCDIAYAIYGKVFDFYWIVLSKSDWEAQVYRASTHTLSEGSALVNKALIAYKKCLQSGVWPDNLDALPKANIVHEILEI